MRLPNAAGLLIQETDQRRDPLARHLAKTNNVRIHSRDPRRGAIVVLDVISALAKSDVPAQHSQVGVGTCRLNEIEKTKPS